MILFVLNNEWTVGQQFPTGGNFDIRISNKHCAIIWTAFAHYLPTETGDANKNQVAISAVGSQPVIISWLLLEAVSNRDQGRKTRITRICYSNINEV